MQSESASRSSLVSCGMCLRRTRDDRGGDESGQVSRVEKVEPTVRAAVGPMKTELLASM